jgi:hypothetical protein
MKARKSLSTQNVEKGKGPGLLKRSFAILGPGLITGAADDDPSGISTYSVAGAAYGYATLWIALLTFPLMAAVQQGFREFQAARRTIQGYEAIHMIRKEQVRWVAGDDLLRQIQFIDNLFELAA